MESSNDPAQNNLKLQIAFPKSDEDHRLQLIKIDEAIFAIVHSPLESNGPIQLKCEEWSLILLSPIKSKTNIVISAINLICLNEIESQEGLINIHTSKHFVKFGPLIKPSEKTSTITGGGEYQFDSDVGAVLYYYRLYQEVINDIHTGTPESLAKAQQQFITSLCAIAAKIENDSKELNLQKVLHFWGISNR